MTPLEPIKSDLKLRWGRDHPHPEAAWGYTQEPLQGLFDSVAEETVHRTITGSGLELFCAAGEAPALSEAA